MKYLRRLWGFFLRFWLILFSYFKPAKKRRSWKKKKDNLGCLYYFGDLLDRLDVYFKAIRKLKKCDREGYLLYRKLGAQVFAGDFYLEAGELKKFWLDTRPAFGMLHLGSTEKDEQDDIIPVKLIYYQKLKCPNHVQYTNHDIYQMTCFYQKEGSDFMGVFDCHGYVNNAKRFTLLKQVEVYELKVGSHTIRQKNGTYVTRPHKIQRKRYGYPSFWDDILEDHQEDFFKTVPDYLNWLFCLVANSLTNSGDGIQVDVKKKPCTAVFNIDMLRTPYFFKDREKTVNHNGNTKKIFHIVRTHKRVTKDGRGRYIKTHFRGLQKFWWNGYDVKVKSPKRRVHLNEFPIAGTVYENNEFPENAIGMEKIGGMLKDAERTSEAKR